LHNYKMILQYEGTRYQGWQRQDTTNNTIQGKLEDILKKMTGTSVKIHGSGRTDAGVHAKAQVANFHLEEAYEPYKLMDYLNQYLPEDIRVIELEEVPERFHSRLIAKEKIYTYRIDQSKVADVFLRRYSYHIDQKLDLEEMKKAANQLLGTHDFKAFCSNRRMKKSTIRTIYQISIEQEGSILKLTYRGNGFLYHMVRLLTGTLLEVGLGKRSASSIPSIIESRERENAGTLAPAQGLILEQVIY